MTNEDAIKILDQMPIPASLNFTFEEMAEALQMAIEALRKMDLIKFNVYALNELLRGEDNKEIFKEVEKNGS